MILSQNKCYYCGRSPHRARKKYKSQFIYNGIDRKDSSLPHTIENSVTCCWDCNKMKSNMNKENFINHVRLISNNLGSQ